MSPPHSIVSLKRCMDSTELETWSSISEKTVFVLDKSPYFSQVSSGHSIDGDCLKDHKKTAHLYANQPTIAPFDRSLWTCTVEAVVGYSRLVWDIFTPDQRCVSILSVRPDDVAAQGTSMQSTAVDKICSWQDGDQNLDHLMKSLARASQTHQPPRKLVSTKDIASFPNCGTDSNHIINSLERAIDELATTTAAQSERINRPRNKSVPKVENNGRVILISSFQDEKSLTEVVNKFEQMLRAKNERLKDKPDQTSANSAIVDRIPINYCDLLVVNTFPIHDEGSSSKISNSTSFHPFLHCKIYSVESGRIIAGLLNNLCLQHHNLRSTTITGIPMKEEQNASSSSQYDVEIVHCSSIHEDIMNSGNPLFEGVVEVIDRNGFPCNTFKLSWCTPKTTAVELNHCIATSRITAVDVNSRPSACLTNFLLNGRTVMLEIFKSKSNRMATHLLASHNGELYIHSLATMQQRLNLGDPPSMADTLGGKVGNYRINDFVTFMKQHTLCRSHITDDPLEKSCNIIKRQTLYWPLTLGHTILLNVPHLLGRLLQLMPKESLTQSDVDECKRAIDGLAKFEQEKQAIPSVSIVEVIKTINAKVNVAKLDQLYKLLRNELEHFLRVYATTNEHESVLEYLLDKDKARAEQLGLGKRPAGKTSQAGPVKRLKPSESQLPEISDPSAATHQTAVFYQTGMSLWQTWSQIHHHVNKHKRKLTFVCRQPPMQQVESAGP